MSCVQKEQDRLDEKNKLFDGKNNLMHGWLIDQIHISVCNIYIFSSDLVLWPSGLTPSSFTVSKIVQSHSVGINAIVDASGAVKITQFL